MKLNLLFILLVLSTPVKTEYFSSMAQLRKLLDYVRHSDVTSYLDGFIGYQKSRLANFRLLHEGLEFIEDVTKEPNSMEFPLNALRVVERAAYVSLLGNGSKVLTDELQFNQTVITEYMALLPNETDLEGSAVGIVTIQDIYGLSLQDIADGLLKNHPSRGLTAAELIDIAKLAPNVRLRTMDDFAYTSMRGAEILEVALTRALPTDILSLYTTFVELVTNINCMCTQFYHSFVNKLLELDPELRIPNTCSNDRSTECESLQLDLRDEWTEMYKTICRGDTHPSVECSRNRPPTNNLKCRYVHNNDPRLILSPEKVEQLNHFNPEIGIIHNLIDERYVQFFMDEATDNLRRGTTFVPEGKRKNYHKVSQQYLLPSHYRQSKMKHLRGRISALTKLRLGSFEDILVVNYACGGIYAVHTDAFTKYTAKSYSNGMRNRLVTIVMYLNEVDDGGETAFPYLDIRVAPIKYAGLMFYNMYHSMNTNYLASHSSCPIVYGEKWIANQWIVNHGQEFTFPCLLDKSL